jgi:isocitrate lyase
MLEYQEFILKINLLQKKNVGHVGGKVVIPTHEYIKKLNSARLASDVAGIPIVIIARTDALNAKLITSDFDDRDREIFK